MSENNLPTTGEISADEVKRIISRCNGTQYTAKPMTEAPDTLKHELKPVVNGDQWFVRFYFVQLPADLAISVHKSKFPRA